MGFNFGIGEGEVKVEVENEGEGEGEIDEIEGGEDSVSGASVWIWRGWRRTRREVFTGKERVGETIGLKT